MARVPTPVSLAQITMFRETVAKVVSMLTERGLEVTQRGLKAYVTHDAMGKPTSVNIPHIPDNADEGYLSAIRGFIDNQCAHVMLTDQLALSRAVKTNKNIEGLAKTIEDIRVEPEWAERFPGSAAHLNDLWGYVFAEATQKAIAKAKSPQEVMQALFPVALHAWAGKRSAQEFMDKHGYWDLMKPVLERIEHLKPRIEGKIASTQEAVDIAQEIMTALKMPPGGGDGDGDESEGGDGKGDKKDKKDKSKKDKSKKGEKADGEPCEDGDEGEDGEGEEGEGEGEGEGEDYEGEDGEGEGEGEGSDESDDGEGDGDGEEGGDAEPEDGYKSGGRPSGRTPTTDKMPEFDMGSLAEQMKALDDILADKMAEKARESLAAGKYTIWTTDFDEWVKPEPDARSMNAVLEEVEKMDGETRAMVGNLSNQFRRLFAAQDRVLNTGGLRRGRLQTSALHRLAAGDDRVFFQREEHQAIDTAVTLLIDCSGSMGGRKIDLALTSANAFSQTLERVGIKHEILGFTCRHERGGLLSMEDRKRKDEDRRLLGGRGFSREDFIRMLIFKGFDERLRDGRIRMASMRHRVPNPYPLHENIDGESVMYAARRLILRREPRKVLIVFSDGSPHASGDYGAMRQHLKDTVREVTKTGLEVLGIGIMSDEVTRFYPHNVVLHDVAKLPETVMKEMTKLLLPKAGR